MYSHPSIRDNCIISWRQRTIGDDCISYGCIGDNVSATTASVMLTSAPACREPRPHNDDIGDGPLGECNRRHYPRPPQVNAFMMSASVIRLLHQ